MKKLFTIIFVIIPVLCFAQFYFGRNKIQYDQFSWQSISTEHFNIYYYPEEEKIAEVAAYLAEKAFDELEQKFNHTIDKPIPLIVYSSHLHFQQTNVLPYWIPEGVGGFFEFIKYRVVIPFPGNMADFNHVITHELVHVFMHRKLMTLSEDFGLLNLPQFPLWFIEGLAEFWSEGWDSKTEMFLRDAVLHDYLLPLDSYSLIRSGFLLYKEGQSFLQFFQKKYGADRIRALLENCWKYQSFQDGLSHISGKKYSILMNEWRIYLKQRFAESLPGETVLNPGEFQLTEYGANIKPVVYSDSSGEHQLVFLTNRNGYTDIFQKPLYQHQEKLVIKGERNGERESLHFLQSGIHVNKEGILIYVAKAGQQDAIYLYHLEMQEEVQSFQHPKIISIRSPKWSPNGQEVIFSGTDYMGQSDLYLWDIRHELILRLTDDLYSDEDPWFDPSGRLVVFSSDRANPEIDGGMDLFLIELSTRSILRLTQDGFKNIRPFWIENSSSTITYLSDRSGVLNVWSFNLSQDQEKKYQMTNLQQHTHYHTGVYDHYPYHPDSLVICAFQKYNFQIHHLPFAGDSLELSSEPLLPIYPDSIWTIPDLDKQVLKKKRPYKLKYSLDFAQTGVAYDPIFGFLGGAQMGISDLMGNRYYHFLLFNTAETSSEILDRINVAVTMVDLTQRSNRAIGVFHFANDYYNTYEGFYFERAIGLRAALNYPIDVFRRIEFSGSVWQSNKNNYIRETQNTLLVSNFISFVHDNSLWTYTGPIDGWRFRLTAGPTFDFRRSQIHNYSIIVDFRTYYRFHRNFTFAQRTMAWYNEGTDIRRYYIGGSWGLRGYGMREIYGQRFILLNHELRFPFARSLMLQFGRSGLGLAPIRGALFIDVGNAWDYKFPGMVGSFGLGLRGIFLGGLVLRLDIGRKTNFKTVDNKWFFQFFFGWDY